VEGREPELGDPRIPEWPSTEDVARVLGCVTSRSVRRQIELGRLRARVLLTGRRPTYRIRRDDLACFLEAFVIASATDER
jgi:hypothetical protein